jgi:hypothetical protein
MVLWQEMPAHSCHLIHRHSKSPFAFRDLVRQASLCFPLFYNTLFKPDCPRVMIVPMVRPVSSGEVEITGFAAFFLEGVGGSGNDNYVLGRFVKMVVSGESGGGTDYGAYAVKLLH